MIVIIIMILLLYRSRQYMYVYVFNKVIQKTEMVLREHTIWEKLIKKQTKKHTVGPNGTFWCVVWAITCDSRPCEVSIVQMNNKINKKKTEKTYFRSKWHILMCLLGCLGHSRWQWAVWGGRRKNNYKKQSKNK